MSKNEKKTEPRGMEGNVWVDDASRPRWQAVRCPTCSGAGGMLTPFSSEATIVLCATCGGRRFVRVDLAELLTLEPVTVPPVPAPAP